MGLSIDFGILPSQFKGLEFFMVLMGHVPANPRLRVDWRLTHKGIGQREGESLGSLLLGNFMFRQRALNIIKVCVCEEIDLGHGLFSLEQLSPIWGLAGSREDPFKVFV